MPDDFPREHARTRRFTLGRPRGFQISADGSRLLFVRARSGYDPVHLLWALQLVSGEERLLVDPAALPTAGAEVPAAERARRERMRETGSGIVAFATDRDGARAAFVLDGQVFLCDTGSGDTTALAHDGQAVDPRPDPRGGRVAYVSDGALWVADAAGCAAPVRLAADADPAVTWGLAEFVAAEEMGRVRGYWWGPDGDRLAVCRVDVGPVAAWHIARPADPAATPTVLHYPAAGTPNADVRLAVVDLTGARVDVAWDRGSLPYLADVRWSREEPLTLTVQSRDQKRLVILRADPDTGDTQPVRELTDGDWVDLVPGSPRWLDDGRLVLVARAGDTARVLVDGVPASPPELHVRALVDADTRRVLCTASGRDPAAVELWALPLTGGAPYALTRGGSADATARAGVVVVSEQRLEAPGQVTTVQRAGGRRGVRSVAVQPALAVRVEIAAVGARELQAALVLPLEWQPADGPLPVLLDPYGGPHGQRVLRARHAYLVPQWFAQQGFAVLVTDGRGTPGRGAAWERAVAGDLATAPLQDQVDGLAAADERWPGTLDRGRVAIRGWSFGGYLAALAVLRRPDVFHAAIAGAPVTDWRLYDTHYTERYLGQPDDGDAYTRSSLLADAGGLRRPLLLLHGLDDDNVVVAHTLRLSQALLEAGRPHRVLPLSGVTHMTTQETVAENLLRLQLDFLQETLGRRTAGG